MAVPKMKRSEVLNTLQANGVDLGTEKAAILGIRGYYKRTMGDPLKNDRNLYDDAIFVISKDRFNAFQANTDPSVFRKGIATLLPGVYEAVKWRHHGKYAALQIETDRLTRDGKTGIDVGRHGINFHYGGIGTWSEGCQTFRKADFTVFQRLVYELMDRYGLSRIKYVLVEN